MIARLVSPGFLKLDGLFALQWRILEMACSRGEFSTQKDIAARKSHRVESRRVAEVDDLTDIDLRVIRPARGPLSNERAIGVCRLATLAADRKFERRVTGTVG